jgi:hypothetical protein
MRCTRLALIHQPSARSSAVNAPIAVATIDTGQLDDRRGQGRFIIPDQVQLALSRPRLADTPAGPPLRNVQPLLQMHYALTSAFGA